MKKNIGILLACFVVSFVLTIFLERVTKNNASNAIYSLKKPSEFSLIIDEFWQISLTENKGALEKLITKMPNNYYDMLNKCDEESGETAKRLNSKVPGLNWITHGIDESKINFARTEIYLEYSRIKKKNFTSYKIIYEREVGNHAIVKVEFGENDRSRFEEGLFLLNKENGKWKIFMITGTWYLKQDNRYFAKSDCSN